MDGLFRSIPGLNAVSNGPGANRMVDRGVSSQTGENNFSVTADTVAVYLDDTPPPGRPWN
jgi:hypothetical protein